MTITVAQLDRMTDTEAAFKLAACCGSSVWVSAMLARRPFGTPDTPGAGRLGRARPATG